MSKNIYFVETKQKPMSSFKGMFCAIRGGADRDRTDDPLLAKQMLSQLS